MVTAWDTFLHFLSAASSQALLEHTITLALLQVWNVQQVNALISPSPRS